MNSSTTLECPDPKTSASAVQTGKLTVNLDRRVVTVDGNPVHLTGKEYEVLELLSLRKGKILTKEMFSIVFTVAEMSQSTRSSMSSSVGCAKSWRWPPAAVITSRRCGVAAMLSEIRLSGRGQRHAVSTGKVRATAFN
jgi:hypothetical protein